MNTFYLLPALWLFNWLFPAWHTVNAGSHRNDIKWVIQKTSSLNIAGRTNINNFACGVNEYSRRDTITCTSNNDEQTPGAILKGGLLIDINSFDCSNKLMTAEFKRTLKKPLYPYLRIEFISLEKIPGNRPTDESIKGCVYIELAGISKRFEINYTLIVKNDACIELIGSRTFCFSDFSLEPPKRMGGLIRVENEINVQFHLYIQQIK